MKAIVSIILASLILFLSAGFKVATHYCGDVAVNTSIGFDGVAESCGMESKIKNDCNSNSSKISKSDCCKNTVIILEIGDDYQPSNKSISNLDFKFVHAFVHVFFQNLVSRIEVNGYGEYSPPLVQHNILVEHQAFLI